MCASRRYVRAVHGLAIDPCRWMHPVEDVGKLRHYQLPGILLVEDGVAVLLVPRDGGVLHLLQTVEHGGRHPVAERDAGADQEDVPRRPVLEEPVAERGTAPLTALLGTLLAFAKAFAFLQIKTCAFRYAFSK